MLNDATGGAVTARRPSPREEAAYSLHLAAHDPTTDLSVAADCLRDVIAATNAYGLDWRVDFSERRGDKAIALSLWGNDDFEPVYGVMLDSVAEVLLLCERLLLGDSLCELAVRDAVDYSEAAS